MSIHNTFEGAQFIATIADIVKENGITLQVGTNFTEYAEIIECERVAQPLGVPFDNRRTHIDSSNGFWIIGRDIEGELIHTQALRLIDLAGLSLSNYLVERFTDFPPVGIDLDFARSRYHPGPGARSMFGAVCYHGEFWLKDCYRGTGISSVLARFALVSSLLKWSPDYVIGFMPRPIAFKGLAEREGYMHAEPGCLYWHRSDSEKILEGFMVWMGREDIKHILGIPLHGLVS